MRGDEGHVGEGNVGGLSGCRLHELVTAELVELGGEEVHRLCRQLESKDSVAGLKHHGSEGRIGPAAGSPYCQTLLSELPRN